MPQQTLPFETHIYDNLPISTMICLPVRTENGQADFKLIYANKIFLRDWEEIYPNTDYHGALLREKTLMDDYSLSTMEKFLTEKPHSFSSFLPMVGLHLHYEPMTDLPEPYCGYFITNLTDYEEQEARIHFLRNIRQMQNTAALLQIHEHGRLESIFVSPDFAAMMECGQDEAVALIDGSGFVRSFHPEDRSLVRAMLKRRVSDDGTGDLTVQLITTKGHSLWCSVHFAFIDDFHEHYVYCTFFNVTVLKEYEERLRSVYVNLGNNFYQVDESTLGLFRVNLTRDLIEDTKGVDLYDTDLIGRSYGESLRLRAVHFPIESERARFLEAFDNQRLIDGYLRGRTTVSQALYSHRSSGRNCFVNYSAVLTRHPMTSDVIAFVTERECNSEKVSQTLLNKILAQQFDMVSFLAEGRYGVVIGDAARITKGSIFPITRNGEYRQYLNEQVLPVLSGSEEERAEQARALAPETIEEQLKVRDPYVVNISCDMNGETYYKRFDFYTIDPEAKFYILLKSDTTESQREQILRNEQLRDALKEAEQANVAKTAFLSSMSHEIRTPMNAIIGLDTIALKEPALDGRTREHLEKIGSSARHLLGLINDILDMSRIESGRMTLKNEEFSFGSVLEQINTMINSQCQDKGLHYRCDVLGAVDDYYIGDDMKLKQVLINILGNAVKFTNAGGSVSMSVERTGRFADQSSLRFIIKDTGIGMDKEYLPKIFEAFSQEDGTTTNKYGGSGLGMAITKNIVEMMNGSISVDSEKGVGSTFTVNVSLRNSERSEQENTRLGDLSPQDLHVLIIDDDPVAREHAQLVLEEIGVTADCADGGREALEMIQLNHARQNPYNLILVDLKMPDKDGIEVTEEIREKIGQESAVILLTAYDWADVEDRAVSAGIDSFLRKPLFAGSVMEEFRQAMAKKREGPETAEKADLNGRKILLAEDMFINAEIMKELLSMQGMTAEHAENGQIAVDMFAASPPGYYDAVLMDVRMPVLDGLGAASGIRALDRPDAKTVPIIAMTANAFDEDVQRSLQAGMNAHLTKPVEPEKLYDTLASYIRG